MERGTLRYIEVELGGRLGSRLIPTFALRAFPSLFFNRLAIRIVAYLPIELLSDSSTPAREPGCGKCKSEDWVRVRHGEAASESRNLLGSRDAFGPEPHELTF